MVIENKDETRKQLRDKIRKMDGENKTMKEKIAKLERIDQEENEQENEQLEQNEDNLKIPQIKKCDCKK